MKTKSQQILEEAGAAADKAAALSAFMKTEGYKTLRIENIELWTNIFELRTDYELLAEHLNRRAELEAAAEKKKASEPRPVYAGRL